MNAIAREEPIAQVETIDYEEPSTDEESIPQPLTPEEMVENFAGRRVYRTELRKEYIHEYARHLFRDLPIKAKDRKLARLVALNLMFLPHWPQFRNKFPRELLFFAAFLLSGETQRGEHPQLPGVVSPFTPFNRLGVFKHLRDRSGFSSSEMYQAYCLILPFHRQLFPPGHVFSTEPVPHSEGFFTWNGL